jgi:hypothetical protein
LWRADGRRTRHARPGEEARRKEDENEADEKSRVDDRTPEDEHVSDPTLASSIPVVHVGHDEPATVRVLAKSQRELPYVGLVLVSGETADDVTDRALG